MKTVLMCLLLLSLYACSSEQHDHQAKVVRREIKVMVTEVHTDALKIADEYLHKNYPDIDVTGYDVQMLDKGHFWVIDFLPPKGAVGGGPQIKIDKSTGLVTEIVFTQ